MSEKKLAKHWWSILVRGIVALLFALLAFFATGFTLSLLVIFLGVYLVLDGLFAIIGGLMACCDHKNWWMLLIEGIVSLAAGIFVLLWPEISLVIMLYIVAIWAILTGIFEFIASMTASWAAPGKVFLGTTGVLSIILGVMVVIYPTFSLAAITWLLGIYALVIGVSLIFMGLRLRATLN
jgi:uncharacterized membrane protein HdeD (DUF308 family)